MFFKERCLLFFIGDFTVLNTVELLLKDTPNEGQLSMKDTCDVKLLCTCICNL